MASLNPKQTLKNLKRKGFVINNKADKHLEFWHNGKFVLYTYISHGSKHEINEYLIHQMSSQCLLSKNDFLDLANFIQTLNRPKGPRISLLSLTAMGFVDLKNPNKILESPALYY